MRRPWTLLLLIGLIALPVEGEARHASRSHRKVHNSRKVSRAKRAHRHRAHRPRQDRQRTGEARLEVGAVVKPSEFRIRSPFPCGVPLRVNCAYGPSCSPAHKRTQSDNAPNDRYAVDFTRDESNNGYDRAVTAVASGVVLQAGWTRGGWSPYGQVVYIQHDFEDAEGHRYQTLYAHLNRVKVQKGQRVRPGMVIGTLGGSSKHRLGRMGPHLHFAMYQDAKPTLGGGRAVLPQPMGHFQELRTGLHFISCGHPEPHRVATLDPRELEQLSRAVGGWEPEPEPTCAAER